MLGNDCSTIERCYNGRICIDSIIDLSKGMRDCP
jgi:hypothetical protein